MRGHFAKPLQTTLVGFLAALVVSCQPAEQKRPPALAPVPDKDSAVQADNAVPFGFKCAWLALKTDDPQGVVQALGLQNVRKSGWREGVDAAYSGEVFVTPPIKGWVLAVSISLPEIADKTRPDQLSPLVKALVTKFPE